MWYDFAEKAYMMLQEQLQCSVTVMRSVSWRSSGYLPRGTNSFHDADGSQHRGCGSVLLGRAQLMQIHQGLSHSQVSSWVLQGPLCLGPPPNTWETSERLLPLSAAKLSHLVLLALKSGQLVEPRHISNISQPCKQPILCKSLSFIFNRRLGSIFFPIIL